jgi:hypothetical protein
MSTEDIKLLDQYGIKDGLIRESLIRCTPRDTIDCINAAIEKRFQQIEILREIKDKLLDQINTAR